MNAVPGLNLLSPSLELAKLLEVRGRAECKPLIPRTKLLWTGVIEFGWLQALSDPRIRLECLLLVQLLSLSNTYHFISLIEPHQTLRITNRRKEATPQSSQKQGTPRTSLLWPHRLPNQELIGCAVSDNNLNGAELRSGMSCFPHAHVQTLYSYLHSHNLLPPSNALIHLSISFQFIHTDGGTRSIPNHFQS